MHMCLVLKKTPENLEKNKNVFEKDNGFVFQNALFGILIFENIISMFIVFFSSNKKLA